jgi:sec-independent protein translocase protein TatC
MAVGYLTCLGFNAQLFRIFKAPFERAAANLPYDPPLQLTQITPTEQFYVQFVKLPLLAAIFLGAPWLMYQAWGFISPGLYKRERRWAAPFIFSTAGLFILGGVFCYYIALRFALAFLIGIGFDQNVRPMIQLTAYYDMFFNLHVGLGVVFQMPIVIVFFTLLRITTPGFLLANVRYAILIIFVLAAVITPTPDVTTMLTFAAPMILLFYVGIGGSYLIVLRREGRSLPWLKIFLALLGFAAAVAAIIAFLHFYFGYQILYHWPYLTPPAVIQ